MVFHETISGFFGANMRRNKRVNEENGRYGSTSIGK